jgi:hypothetical protein
LGSASGRLSDAAGAAPARGIAPPPGNAGRKVMCFFRKGAGFVEHRSLTTSERKKRRCKPTARHQQAAILDLGIS